MKIPEDVMKKWNELKSHGDGKKIAQESGHSEMHISRAFVTGECSDEVFESLAKFFKSKEGKIQSVLQ